MPKNLGGGKRYKKRKNKGPVEPGPIMYADADQEYGIVTKRLGNGLVELVISKGCAHPRPALGKIRGILRKRRVPFNVGSIVIVSGRGDCMTNTMVGKGENTREKVDVLHCYYDDQAKRLYREEKIPSSFRSFADSAGTKTLAAQAEDSDEADIVFDDMSDDDGDGELNIDDL
jgi:translation initiation factor IF-1